MSLLVNIKKKIGSFELRADFQMGADSLAILGASGSGKSMTLKCIAGIETPDEGRIVLHDRVLFDSAGKINLPPQKRRVGYMFQDYALFPNMTVEQNIMAGMDKKTGKKAEEYIRRFHLTGLEKHYPHQLSGGQKHRTAMARMIAAEPEAILLDEPFSALDTHLRWELETEMRELLEQLKKPAILVSHDRNEVYRICSMAGYMNKGRMNGARNVKEFFDKPLTKTAAILSGCKNLSAVRVMDETHLYACDWHVILEVPAVPKDTAYVGIRAHSFQPYREEMNQTNCFRIGEYQILDDLFEWNISYKTDADSRWLQWKIAKNTIRGVPEIPNFLTVNGDAVLCLQEDEI